MPQRLLIGLNTFKKYTHGRNRYILKGMYDIPITQVQIEYTIPVAEYSHNPQQYAQDDVLIISVDEAQYEPDKELAHIKMSEAFKKSRIILEYDGNTVILTYNDNNTDRKNCPHIDVPISDITRDINFMDDIVTIYISNISTDVANKIHENLCLSVNADTVKSVSAPIFPPPKVNTDPYDHLNP